MVRGPQLVGIVSRQRIVDALRSDGNGYVQSVMSRAFQVARPEDTLGTTIRRLTAGRGLSLIPVTESGRVVGIVSVQNLMSSMSLLAEQRRLRAAGRRSRRQFTGLATLGAVSVLGAQFGSDIVSRLTSQSARNVTEQILPSVPSILSQKPSS